MNKTKVKKHSSSNSTATMFSRHLFCRTRLISMLHTVMLFTECSVMLRAVHCVCIESDYFKLNSSSSNNNIVLKWLSGLACENDRG